MTFDPELCYQMGCDFYQFNIELKGISCDYSNRAIGFFPKLSVECEWSAEFEEIEREDKFISVQCNILG